MLLAILNTVIYIGGLLDFLWIKSDCKYIFAAFSTFLCHANFILFQVLWPFNVILKSMHPNLFLFGLVQKVYWDSFN